MSSGNGEKWSISASWVFRGTKYTVCADVRDDMLMVQVKDKLPSYIAFSRVDYKLALWLLLSQTHYHHLPAYSANIY